MQKKQLIDEMGDSLQASVGYAERIRDIAINSSSNDGKITYEEAAQLREVSGKLMTNLHRHIEAYNTFKDL